ncbi:putative RNA helicase [Tieghemostelium lacteum]|uniref:RNA helicase n=1 Tax=Tieghemostelium lacteum TaxID=361077 RepID=A0A152A4G4_TIELA|nr:putative RNA helicase [Tieghemostelium lacteum]|eukprot:KYR01132.1 putative RNA helicase [Tieghemostelium lacteum]
MPSTISKVKDEKKVPKTKIDKEDKVIPSKPLKEEKKKKKQAESSSESESSSSESESDNSESESEKETKSTKKDNNNNNNNNNNNKKEEPKQQQQPKQPIQNITEKPTDVPEGVEILSTLEWRKKHNVTVEGDVQVDPYQLFTDFQIPKIFNHVFQQFTQPTVIQGQCWPIAATGRDLVGLAATGSGKTLAFLLPALIKILQTPKRPSYSATPLALVIAPTRELAQQIEEVCKQSIRQSSIRALCCYGGLGKYEQTRTLRNGVDIVVGTPGRISDLLTDRHLKTVQYLVLDEADRMLDMGFLPQIQNIVKYIPAERQTLMFSATWPREVKQLATEFLKNPIKVTVGNTELTGNINVTQNFIQIDDKPRSERDSIIFEKIKDIQNQDKTALVIVFCNEKYRCDDLQHDLKVQHGINSIVLHSGKEQSQREHGLRLFRAHKIPILFATDVAARGLDIPSVRAVINASCPKNIEDYVHRIGRTGRAGATGESFTLIATNEDTNLRDMCDILIRSKQNIPDFLAPFQRRPNNPGQYSAYGGGGRSRYGNSRGGRGGGGRGGRGGYGGRNGGGNSWGDKNSNGEGNSGYVAKSFGGDYKSGFKGGRGGGGRGNFNRNGGGNSWGGDNN